MTKPQTLGERIELARSQKGLTQEEVGKKLGHASGQLVSRWESGEGIGRKNLQKLAAVLGKTVDWLVSGDVAPAPAPGRSATTDALVRRLAMRYRARQSQGAARTELAELKEDVYVGVQEIVIAITGHAEPELVELVARAYLNPLDDEAVESVRNGRQRHADGK